MNENIMIELIKSLKEDLTHRLDRIEDKMDGFVNNSECKNMRKNCTKMKELSIKKITGISGVIVGLVAVIKLIVEL